MTNAQAWDYAVGMIKVDGLEPTEEFKEYIEKEKRGEVTMEDIKEYLDKKYKVKEATEQATVYLYNNVKHLNKFVKVCGYNIICFPGASVPGFFI